jgi:hypothetical protein
MFKDTFFAPQQLMTFWKKAGDDQLQRMQTLGDEWAKMEAKGFEQWSSTVDEMAKLTKESLAYSAQLTNEWRKTWLDAVKKNGEAIAKAG